MNRDDFPVLKNNPGLIYLDSANTTLKPQCVIDAVNAYYTTYSANIGRASYNLAERATREFESARTKVARFIDVKPSEIIFTQSASYAINQIARGIQHLLKPGDQILLTRHEHNSNLLIWYQLAKEIGIKIRFVEDLAKDGDVSKIKLFSYSLVDNTAGELYDYSKLVGQLKEQGAMIAIDISQAVAHLPLSVRKLDCDFAVFSGHKMYGPSGVGALYIRQDLQPHIEPLVYGSQTFAELDTEHSQFTLLNFPAKFEPGTPNIEGVIGLGAAVEYLISMTNLNIGRPYPGRTRPVPPFSQREVKASIPPIRRGRVAERQLARWSRITSHEQQLIQHYHQKVKELDLGKYVFNDSPKTIGVAILSHPDIHPHDIALLLDERYRIAVRAGKVCADLVANHFGERRGLLRASFGLYTTPDEIDEFLTAYREIIDELS